MNDDRRRQVETTKKRHGEDFYKNIGKKSARFKDPKLAKEAINKRWDKVREDKS